VRRYEGRIGRVARPILGAVLAVGSFTAFATGLVHPVDLKLVDFGTPVFGVLLAIAIVTGLSWMLRAVVEATNLHSAPTLSLLAESTFMVTLTHAGILWALDPLALPYIAQFALALFVPWSLALVVRHTRASQLLTGMPRRPLRTTAAAAPPAPAERASAGERP
jgi:hypothetical protein